MTLLLVVGRAVVLREVIAHVDLARAPINVELTLLDAVADPVEAHIHGFGSTLLDVVVADSGGARIVNLDRGGWLGPAQFLEGRADGAGVLGIVVDGADFSLCGGSHDISQDVADNVDDAIVGRRGARGLAETGPVRK